MPVDEDNEDGFAEHDRTTETEGIDRRSHGEQTEQADMAEQGRQLASDLMNDLAASLPTDSIR